MLLSFFLSVSSNPETFVADFRENLGKVCFDNGVVSSESQYRRTGALSYSVILWLMKEELR